MMNRTFNALLLSGIIMIVFEVMGSSVSSQRETLKDFEGLWEFEKAEIIERRVQSPDYLVKHEINTVEEYGVIPSCHNQVIKSIRISDVTLVESPFSTYCGRASLTTFSNLKNGRYLFIVGVDENEINQESPIPGQCFNVYRLEYWIEKIDPATISITQEAFCLKDSIETHGILTCIMKKSN